MAVSFPPRVSKRGVLIAGIAAAALAGVVLYYLQSSPVESRMTLQSSELTAPLDKSITETPSVSPIFNSAPPSLATRSNTAHYLEIRDSKNLRDTLNKLQDLPDPTGEISFHLFNAVLECAYYGNETLTSTYDRAYRNKDAAQREIQANAIAQRASRCSTFDSWHEITRVTQTIRERSISAKHPGTMAMINTGKFFREGRAVADANAIELMETSLNADVIAGVASYVLQRNSGPFMKPEDAGRHSVQRWTIYNAAWTLFQCDLGADCSPQSALMIRACTQESFCAPANDAYQLFKEQRLTPTEYAAAIELKTRLTEALNKKDWAQLGLYPIADSPAKRN
jgi:hypothetical protein